MRPITSALGPVADAVARRLAEGQPSSSNASIRNACFGFTIGPRREWRWCGMALCGHRYKGCTIQGETRRPCRLEAMFEG